MMKEDQFNIYNNIKITKNISQFMEEYCNTIERCEHLHTYLRFQSKSQAYSTL